ncbi:hypothetical protein JW964_11340 [candidate division KSB1 bacterium]|nr:hypothetical protein [candidate division KSB1 bacterium]
MRWLTWCSVCLGLGIIEVYGANPDFHFSVSPPLLEIKMQPMAKKDFVLNVVNSGAQSLNLRVTVMDLELSPAGEAQAKPVQPGKWSCADWITLSATALHLEPHQHLDFKFSLTTPGGCQGGRTAIIMFEVINPEARRDELQFIGRMGCIVLLELTGARMVTGEIVNFKHQKIENNIAFEITVKNTGNIQLKARGSVLILTSENRIVDRLPVKVGTGTILPDGFRIFQAVWNNRRKMQSGKYTVRVQIYLQGGKTPLQLTRDLVL